MSYLAQVNMVSREREPGSRRDRYVLHNELWYETFTETAAFFEFMQGELLGLLERRRAYRATLDLG